MKSEFEKRFHTLKEGESEKENGEVGEATEKKSIPEGVLFFDLLLVVTEMENNSKSPEEGSESEEAFGKISFWVYEFLGCEETGTGHREHGQDDVEGVDFEDLLEEGLGVGEVSVPPQFFEGESIGDTDHDENAACEVDEVLSHDLVNVISEITENLK